MKEKGSKPIYNKWWFWLIAFFVILTIYGAITGVNQAKEDIENDKINPPEQKEVSKPEDDVEEDPEEDKAKVVNQQLLFGELTVNFETVEIEGDTATIIFKWINQAGDGKKYLFSLAGIDVIQGDDILEETSGAYDVINKNTSDMYFPNAESGETKVTLEYELADEVTPIEITFVPFNDFNEDSQTITVEID